MRHLVHATLHKHSIHTTSTTSSPVHTLILHTAKRAIRYEIKYQSILIIGAGVA
jgi:hypothetical protein